MEKVYGCCGLITNLRNVTDKLSERLIILYNPTNWNALGLNQYGISIASIGFEDASGVIGFPIGAYAYGCLVTFCPLKTETDEFRNAQIYIPHQDSIVNNISPIYVRTFKDVKNENGVKIPSWKIITVSGLINARTQS